MTAHVSRRLCLTGPLLAALLLAVALPPLARAERPPAPELFPKGTLAYVRVRDAQQLAENFQQTALGKMSREDKIRPLIADLYGSAAEAFTQVEDEVGVSLDEILAIPQGEMVFGLVAPRTGRPVLVVLIDVGDQLPAAEKLIETGEQALADEGVARSRETYRDTKLVIHTPPGDRDPLVHFIKENTIVITSNLDVSKTMLDVWNGEAPPAARGADRDSGDGSADSDDSADRDESAGPAFEPLVKNERFVAIMRRCRGTKEDPAQMTFYVDPIGLYRVGSRGNVGAQTTLALLPVLGLDGFEALGGSLTFAAGDFDMITHLHVKLSEPRTGVLEMLALKSDDTTPEKWVPADVARYITINWDANKTYTTLAELYDSFRGEGRLSADVKSRISDRLGVDFETEILDNFGDRITYATWYERPARIGSEAALLGIRLKDPEEFAPVLEKLTDKYRDRLQKDSYGGVTYWTLRRDEMAQVPAAGDPDVSDGERRRLERRRRRQERFRTLRPSPCFAVLDDYLIVADRTEFLHKVIVANGDASSSLAKELDFKLIAGKIRRQVGGAKPGMVTFSRPEEQFKVLYEMATGDETRQRLADAAQGNEFFGALDGALQRNELPPFSVIAQYLAPGGGMLVSDETGFHYTGFVLKRNGPE